MRLIAVLAALLLATSALVSSQGLASIAKKEEERRKTVKTAGKTYTNENLKTDITASTPAAPVSANGSATAPSEVPSVNLPAGDAAPSADAKDEAHWRSRMNTARFTLERSRIVADALQSRLNALRTDIINRDDPAQRAQLELERNRAVAELERVKKEIAEQTKAIAEIEEQARKAGVPPGWLRDH
jgi:hypothetical protein